MGCAGIALFAGLTGLGFASAIYGFSCVYSIQPAAEQTAQALVFALERANPTFSTRARGDDFGGVKA
jgi:hypothetical protein